MNYEQIKALSNLADALHVATDCGALDILSGFCKSPDSINDVCDKIDEALSENPRKTSVQDLLLLWAKLGDIPTVIEGEKVDQIEERFLHFPIGTHREDIWRWFENQNTEFIVGEIMNGKYSVQNHFFEQKKPGNDQATALARRKAVYLRNQGYKDYAAIAVLRKGRRLVLICRGGAVRWLPTSEVRNFPQKNTT